MESEINLPKKESNKNIINSLIQLNQGCKGINTRALKIETIETGTSVDLLLPYVFYHGAVVVHNNEIHILGTSNSSYGNAHYKWDGSTWIKLGNIPNDNTSSNYICEYGSAVSYNGAIHFLYEGSARYVWEDGDTTWQENYDLPYSFSRSAAVVFNDNIHILGSNSSSYYTAHYKYNGSSWSKVSTLPFAFYRGSAVVYNNEIHILGTYGDDDTAHYKYNGSSWKKVSTLPSSFYDGAAVVYNNEIHILGGGDDKTLHYKWNGSSWSKVGTLPYSFYQSCAVVHDNLIHLLGSYTSSYRKYHYVWNGSSWKSSISNLKTQDVFTYYLPKNAQIVCDKTALLPDTESENAALGVVLNENDDGYTVSNTGNVRLLVNETASETQKAHSIIV